MRKDHLGHFLIALFGTAAAVACFHVLDAFGLSVPWPMSTAGALFVGAFYGREQRDAEIHHIQEYGGNLAAAEKNPGVWLPWKWSRDGRWDFFCPVVAVILVGVMYGVLRCYA